MFDNMKMRELEKENTSLATALEKMDGEKERLKSENQQYREEIAGLETKIRELEEISQFTEHQHETELEKTRQQCSIANIDRDGLQLLCSAYFGPDCRVDDTFQALIVHGALGQGMAIPDSLKLVLSKNVCCDRLSQLVELLDPKPYPELAEAIGLASLNPRFMFGQWTTKPQPVEIETQAFFRPGKIERKTTKALVAIPVENVRTSECTEECLVKYSCFKKLDTPCLFMTERYYVFPIDITGTIKQAQQDGYIEGLGFGPLNQTIDWQKTRLFTDCVRRWEQYYPYVTFHGET